MSDIVAITIQEPSTRQVPVAPMPVSCGFTGFPSPAQDYEEKCLSLDQYLNVNENTTWFFRADGHSMVEVGINHGDVLVVDSTADPVLGDICICIVEGEHVAKIIDLVDGKPALLSANKAYPPVFVSEVQIFGVVTGRVTRFRR
jgi:DNA polymerase V